MGGEFFVSLPINGTAVTGFTLGNSQNSGRRPYQEDSFGYSSAEPAAVSRNGFAAVVSDGMGGLSAGDKVSAYTVSAVQHMFDNMPEGTRIHELFTHYINSVSNQVYKSGTGGGATVSAVYCSGSGVFWCSVGDSRIYLYRNGLLHQLSRDLDYQDQLLDRVIDGGLTFEELVNDPKKDSLAEYVGSGEALHPDVNIKPFVPEPGDKLFLCSDGVYNALTIPELLPELSKPAQECADGITAAVLAKQYENQDNFTSVILEFR